MLSLSDIAKELFAEKTRTILTILAIAWGTFAIASMLAVGEGLRLNFAKAVANTGHNLLVIQGGATAKTYRGMHPNITIKLTKKDFRTIAALPNIAAITPQYDFKARFKYQNQELKNIKVQAVADNFAKIHSIPIAPSGRFLDQNDLKKRQAVIVLGSKTHEDFFPHAPNPVGKHILIDNNPFLIIGVMQPKSQIMAQEAPDEDYNWMPFTTHELFTNPQEISSIAITYKNPHLLKKTKNAIRKIIALNHAADPSDENIVNFTDFAEQQKSINRFFLGMQIFLGVIGVLTLLIAAVGITNVMYASVSRATRQIGIRMALGARTTQILIHYIAEALTATVIGGILGMLLSWFFVIALRAIPMQGKLIEAIGKPKPVLSFLVIGIVILVLGVMGLLAGLFPALKATKVDPAEALTYE